MENAVELKRDDGSVWAIEADYKLTCGHTVRGRAQKIPYHPANGLFCYDCNAWVTLLE